MTSSHFAAEKKGRRSRRPFPGDDYRGSEVQTQLALEHSAAGLRSELTPRTGSARSQVGVDRETRIESILRADGLRMVQHVECIHAELEPLRFRDAERFGQIRVEAPNRESWEDVLAQVPALSRLRILEDDQARISAAVVERNGAGRARRNNPGHSLQQASHATGCDLWADRRALWIGDLRPLCRIEEPPLGQGTSGSAPPDAGVAEQFLQQVCIRDIRNAVRVQHVLRDNARPRAGTERVDETKPPVLNRASKDTGTIPQQRPA